MPYCLNYIFKNYLIYAIALWVLQIDLKKLEGKKKSKRHSQQGFPLRRLTAAPKNKKNAKWIGHSKKKLEKINHLMF